MNRVLSAEFPAIYLINDDVTATYGLFEEFETDYVAARLSNTTPHFSPNYSIWINQSTIDLGGYTRQDDLTVYFRNAFPQVGGVSAVNLIATEEFPIDGFKETYSELTMITSVPINQDSLVKALIEAPGFLQTGGYQNVHSTNPIPLEVQGLDRTQIIYGRRTVHGLNTTSGSDSIFADGAGITIPIQEYDFSSLEPTAADTLYCYKVILMPAEGYSENVRNHLTQIQHPPTRVILDIAVNEEPFLSYMMRLQRSHRLASDREYTR